MSCSCCAPPPKKDHHHDDDHDHEGHDHGHEHPDSKLGLYLVILSGLLIATGMILHWTADPAPHLLTILYAIATLAGAILIVPIAIQSLIKLRLDINVLMTVAVAGAWILGEQLEGASVVFLFSLSELLESWAADRARRSVNSLLDLSPPTALVKNPDGTETETPVADVAINSEILIRNGQRIPLDGEILSGKSSIDQASITGESVPVDKATGDVVFAGTVNGEGSLTVKVTKAASDSTLFRIIKLVGEAEEERPPTQRFVDKFAAVYTPLVFVAAILVALIAPLLFHQPWHEWIYKSLVLLVIACPCALVIATPVSIVSGITALARRGVLVKGGIHLESVGKLKALALDKTGTITRGTPAVTDIISLSGNFDADEILRRAATIDTHSSHPLAQAVVNAAKARNIDFTPAENYASLTGRGANATIEGHPHFIGNHRLAHETGLCNPAIEARLADIEAKGQSLAVIGHYPHENCPGEILGIIAIADQIRPEVADALKKLHAAGIEKIIMLSGDNQRTANAIAKEAGIDQAIGDLMPEDKVTQIRDLVSKYQYVGMIGDGVNDAPALAIATVGIAMGGIGSDTAIETADLTLMQDDLTKVAEAVLVGKRALRIIHFNIAFALGIKALVLLLALLGIAGLWLAILADTGATLLVILNALRLLRNKF
jgi:Cd2+/Zn2+-exporting ATPase